MAENDAKPQEVDLKATIASLEQKLETQRAQADAKAGDTAQALARLNGQLEVLTQAAIADQSQRAAEQPERVEAQALLDDPEAVLAKFVDQRTGSLMREQLARDAATQRELAAMKHGEDWKRFGPQIDQLIKDAKLGPDTLAVPGSFERLLNVVKAQNLDTIVKERVDAKVAEVTATFQADAARTAAGSASTPKKEPPATEVKAEELTDEQRRIAAKLGRTPEKYAAAMTKTSWDGVRTTGEVVA